MGVRKNLRTAQMGVTGKQTTTGIQTNTGEMTSG